MLLMVPFRGTFVEKYSAWNYRNRYSSSNSSDGVELVLVTVSSESFKLSLPSGCNIDQRYFPILLYGILVGSIKSQNIRILVKTIWMSGNARVCPKYADIGHICFFWALVISFCLHKLLCLKLNHLWMILIFFLSELPVSNHRGNQLDSLTLFDYPYTVLKSYISHKFDSWY